MSNAKEPIADRFRGYLPVVVDLETGGFNAATDALLEFAAVILDMDDKGRLVPFEKHFFNVDPFPGANIEAASLEFTGIDPDNPLRNAGAGRRSPQRNFSGRAPANPGHWLSKGHYGRP